MLSSTRRRISTPRSTTRGQERSPPCSPIPARSKASAPPDRENGLSRGQRHGAHVRPPTRQRPRVPLCRRRLAARREATGVRSVGVERRQHEHARQGARSLHAEDVSRERPGARRIRCDGRAADRFRSRPTATSSLRSKITSSRGGRLVPRTTQLFKGPVRFVLTSAGHIAGIVNPPSPKVRLWTNADLPADPERWIGGTTEHRDTWWNDWADWITDTPERCGYRPRWETPPTLCSVKRPAHMSEAERSAGAHRVRVGSLSLHCSVTGNEGRPLLLVSGLGANVEMWTPFRRSLGSRLAHDRVRRSTGYWRVVHAAPTALDPRARHRRARSARCSRVRRGRRARLLVRWCDRAGDGPCAPRASTGSCSSPRAAVGDHGTG